ncbi:MFS transporter [Microbacterium sp. Se5.02b]|nr:MULTISPECIES: MFS transporter [unclassified Microbacterium]QNA91331.1 MFS transporter [Microbacterium sp. Se63.02b]QYM64490.1 MFS transporter [Microbacterium sp. Se5.02b]
MKDLFASNRSFRHVWFSQLSGMLGASIMTVSAGIAVLAYGGSAAVIATILAGRSIGLFIGYLTLGGLTAFFSSKRLMILTDVVRVVSTATVAFGIVTGAFWISALAVILTGLCESVFTPASRALLPLVVGKADLLTANGMSAVTRNAMAVAGPAVAGGMLLLVDPILGVLINCVCFALSALALVGVPDLTRDGGRLPLTPRGYWSSLKDGAHAVRSTPWVWMFTLAGGLQMFLVVGAWSVLLPVASVQTGWGDSAYGVVLAVYAAGGLIGGLVAVRIRRHAAVAGAVSIALFSLAPLGLVQDSFAICLILVFAGGAALQVGNVLYDTLFQQHVSPEMIGRVSALMMLPSTAVLPLSYLIVGVAADLVGADSVLLIGGVSAAFVMAGFALLSPIRRLELVKDEQNV